MEGIRRVDFGTFVSSADAAQRARQAAEQHNRLVREHADQPPRDRRGRRGGQEHHDGDAADDPTQDAATGTYDDHGRQQRRDRPNPADAGLGSERHVDIVL